MQFSGSRISYALLVLALGSCDLTQAVKLDKEVGGTISDNCEKDGSYYYIPYLATFESGQVYTVDFHSPDEAPIHFNLDEFDIDEEIELHEVFTFTATSSQEVWFSVYLLDERLYGSADFLFTIREGINGPPVEYQVDADRIAESLVSQIFYAAPKANNTWNNTSKNGMVTGTAVVNGSYSHTDVVYGTTEYDYYEYKPTTIDCVEFQNYDYEPATTGRVSIVGKITETHQYMAYTSTYSGSWTVSATLQLSGLFNDDVVLSLSFYQDSSYEWSGTLTAGSSYTVSGE